MIWLHVAREMQANKQHISGGGEVGGGVGGGKDDNRTHKTLAPAAASFCDACVQTLRL